MTEARSTEDRTLTASYPASQRERSRRLETTTMARTNSAKIIARPSVSLKTQFDVLSKECMKIDDDFTHALAHIHDVLARAFMLYINLERQPAVLVAIYKKDGVKPSSRKDGSKFTPFIKALFRLDLPNPSEADKKRWNLQPQSMKNRVSIYAAALDELDAEYTVRPKSPSHKFIKDYRVFAA
jgi:hypothetical protein